MKEDPFTERKEGVKPRVHSKQGIPKKELPGYFKNKPGKGVGTPNL